MAWSSDIESGYLNKELRTHFVACLTAVVWQIVWHSHLTQHSTWCAEVECLPWALLFIHCAASVVPFCVHKRAQYHLWYHSDINHEYNFQKSFIISNWLHFADLKVTPNKNFNNSLHLYSSFSVISTPYYECVCLRLSISLASWKSRPPFTTVRLCITMDNSRRTNYIHPAGSWKGRRSEPTVKLADTEESGAESHRVHKGGHRLKFIPSSKGIK